jgi:hypothetical protein
MFGNSQAASVQNFQNKHNNLIYVLASGFAYPVDCFLRPRYGTRFANPPIVFIGSALMLFLPAIGALYTSFMHAIPLASIPPAVGLFSLGDFAKVYFLVVTLHLIRVAYLMAHMEKEMVSTFEGDPLPVFAYLPKNTFYFVRIVWEPALVVVLSIVLQDLRIIQDGLALYLRFAALALFMKGTIAKQEAWTYLRNLFDMRNCAPLISKLVQGDATDEELAPIGLASFPKNIPPDIREAAVQQIARAYSPDNPIR